MKYDAYAASIKDTTKREVAYYLADKLDGIPAMGPAMRRYGPTIQIDVGAHMAAWVGETSDGLVYVEGKGETSPALVDAIRTRYPVHGAARIDVAHDRGGDGAFEALQALIRARKGVKVYGGYRALPDDPEDGKTWEAGKRGSVAYLRLYEWGKHPDRVHLGRPDVVRAELEARPHYARDKVAASRMSPEDVWGLTAWTHRVGEGLLACDLARYESQIRKYSFDKTTLYLARTFRRHWEEMLANGEDIQRTLQAVWEEDDQAHIHPLRRH